jgi:hypothetical protein
VSIASCLPDKRTVLIIDRAARDAAIRELVDHYFPRFAAGDDGAYHLRTG